jgi:hypothetical protein
MNWGEVGRFLVGSWLWDKFYPATAEEASSKPSTFSKILLTLRLVAISVLAIMAFKFIQGLKLGKKRRR